MPKKVKIFQDTETWRLEAAMNKWLEENPEISIDHVTQLLGLKGLGDSKPVTVCIWYTERGK